MAIRKKKASRKKAVTRKKAGALSPPNKKASRKRSGRPPFRPTEEQRTNVEAMVGIGLRHEDICQLVRNPSTGQPIDMKTLRRHFREELDRGAPLLEAKIGASLVKRALDLGHAQGTTAAIWLEKTRFGRREEPIRVEAEVKSGVLVTGGQASPEQWISGAMARSANAKEPE